MNKKFSTLVASLLLAGGLFSANAQQAFSLKDLGNDNYYYLLKVDNAGVVSGTTDVKYESYSIAEGGNAVTDLKQVSAENSWKVTPYKMNGEVVGYQFTSANGKKLQFDKNGAYTAKASEVKYDTFIRTGSKLYAVGTDGKKITDKCLTQSGSTYSLASSGTAMSIFSLPTADVTSEVNDYLGDGFEITIGKTKYVSSSNDALVWDGAYTMEGNVFTGKLTLVSSEEITVNDTTEIFTNVIKKANGKYIVLKNSRWGSLSNNLQDGSLTGYIWAEATPAELYNGKIGNTAIKASEFTITQPNAVVEAPLEVKVTDANDNEYELMVATVAGTSYLTTGEASNAVNVSDALSDGTSQLVGAASFTNNYLVNNKVVTENTYVKLGSGNSVVWSIFNDAIWNITRTEIETGETLVAGPDCSSTWVPAAEVATAYPEGQWLWNGSTFVNRESGAELSLTGLREVEGQENVYTDLTYNYTITKVGEPGSTTLGYLNAENDDLLKEAFYIGTPVKATNDTVYIAKDSEGTLYLSADKAEAVEFRLDKFIDRENINSTYSAAAAVDSALIQNRTVYASSKTSSGKATDVLNFYSYILTDAVTGDALAWDATNKTFVLSEDESFGAIIIKNKAEGLYNLISDFPITTEFENKVGSTWYYFNQQTTEGAFCNSKKLYGAHNTAELKQSVAAYADEDNDLFIIEKVDAGQHVSGIYGQNIKLFRDADPNYVLYEEGKLLETKDEVLEGFLGLQNIQDATYADMNPAMYVDSAAGLNTWRPEYMLALDVNVVPAGKYCEIHGANAGCKDEHLTDTEGYIEGRYLVNLVDSAKAGRKDCVYQNYGGDKYYRLGFVAAKHIADSLVIASDNKVINLTGNAHNNMKICEFAFHYTDASRSAFTIETAYDNEYTVNPTTLKTEFKSTQGWIKYHNGVPVVTAQKSDAEVFNLAQTEEEATANETIAASAVTVIAGEGNVTIAGAAGKKVVIANILGQTIANTVLTSDNATIAAPAGVVVVAVEGEAAVKAIVK